MKALLRWLALVALAFVGLQLFFVGRIALMLYIDPQSSSFERSEVWALAQAERPLRWHQHWRPYGEISDHLKRAVIASEDDGFTQHQGVEWSAIERAWQRNRRAQTSAPAPEGPSQSRSSSQTSRAALVRGGSTITQQLAKNLWLSGERTLARKGQELVLTYALEAVLSKQRILEIYLNHVEWGSGIFGAEAAAQHYFGKSAARLSASEAARLAVMLPAPKRFEHTPQSAHLSSRTRSILGRMAAAKLP